MPKAACPAATCGARRTSLANCVWAVRRSFCAYAAEPARKAASAAFRFSAAFVDAGFVVVVDVWACACARRGIEAMKQCRSSERAGCSCISAVIVMIN